MDFVLSENQQKFDYFVFADQGATKLENLIVEKQNKDMAIFYTICNDVELTNITIRESSFSDSLEKFLFFFEFCPINSLRIQNLSFYSNFFSNIYIMIFFGKAGTLLFEGIFELRKNYILNGALFFFSNLQNLAFKMKGNLQTTHNDIINSFLLIFLDFNNFVKLQKYSFKREATIYRGNEIHRKFL